MRYEFVKSFVGRLPLKVSPSSKSSRDHSIGIHYHEEIEILLVEEGERYVYIATNDIRMGKGDIIVIDSLVPHSTFIKKDQKSRLYQFDPAKLTDEKTSNEYLNKFLRRSKKPYAVFREGEPETKELAGILNAISDYSKSECRGHDSYVKGYIYVLLGFMCKTGLWNDIEGALDGKALSVISGAIAFIEKHYMEEISLERIAGDLNLNPSYFCRLFKKATGSTAMAYLNYVRVQEAKKLLSDKERSIAEIAFETGFFNIANFNRTFKKINSSTPSEYRKLCIK